MAVSDRPNISRSDNSLLRGSDVTAVPSEAVMPERTDRNRFNDLTLAHQERVFRFIMTLVPNPSEAEDLLQQTLMTAWTIRDRFDPAQDFVRWLCGIAHNHVRNYLRKRQHGPQLLSSEVMDQLAAEHLEIDEVLEEQRRSLQHCLGQLPPHERAFVERCYGGATIKGVADSMSKSPNVVYKTLRRIRLKLLECINKAVGSDQ
jgi:RNA polymerase sigma-70 factor (ECF subfamily)